MFFRITYARLSIFYTTYTQIFLHILAKVLQSITLDVIAVTTIQRKLILCVISVKNEA